MELYNRTCPKSAAKFRALCTGQLRTVDVEKGGETRAVKLHYRGCPFHRVLPGAFVQAGDVVDGAGDSAAGDYLADESFAVPFDRPGLLAFANDGPHRNNTQFYITLGPLEWLQKRSVAFGRVVKGMDAVRQVAGLKCVNERPVETTLVANCNVVNLKDGFGL